MRLGQPDMERHQAGLGAESGQCQEEGRRAPERRQFLGAHRREAVVTGTAGHDAEGQQDADGADMRDQQVEESGATDFLVLVVGGDEEEG